MEKNENEYLAKDADITNLEFIKDVTIYEDEETEKESTELVSIAPSEISSDEDQQIDYTKSRDTLHKILEIGEESLETIQTLAEESESPRAWEVLSTFMNTLAGAAANLQDLHKAKIKAKKDNPDEPPSVTNNLVFNGSTKELTDMLKEMQDKKS